jgi:hypothetical protein
VRTQDAIKHGRSFLKHVVPAVIKPARTLWNEVIGFLFICFAVMFGFKTVRYAIDWHKATSAPDGGTGELLRLAMAAFCTLLMAYYGVSSFLRARKISRS